MTDEPRHPSDPDQPGWGEQSGEQPTSPYGQPQVNPYAQPYGGQPTDAPYGQQAPNPYDPQQPAPYQPYGRQPGDQPHEQQPYGGQQGYAYGYAPTTQSHPRATTSMVLGLIGLVSTLACCGLGLPLSPFAWWLGAKARKEIDREPGRYHGRELATTGYVTGIIGTVLLVLLVVGVVGLVAFSLSSSTSGSTTGF